MSKQSTVCGAFCGDCHFYGKECKGCTESNGEPFWAANIGLKACPIHGCCTVDEHFAHCGHCRQMPCQLFRNIRDPTMSDEQFEAGLKAREAELRRRQDAEKRA